jgi:hypothetical protein
MAAAGRGFWEVLNRSRLNGGGSEVSNRNIDMAQKKKTVATGF